MSVPNSCAPQPLLPHALRMALTCALLAPTAQAHGAPTCPSSAVSSAARRTFEAAGGEGLLLLGAGRHREAAGLLAIAYVYQPSDSLFGPIADAHRGAGDLAAAALLGAPLSPDPTSAPIDALPLVSDAMHAGGLALNLGLTVTAQRKQQLWQALAHFARAYVLHDAYGKRDPRGRVVCLEPQECIGKLFALFNLARTYHALGQYPEEIALMTRLNARFPDDQGRLRLRVLGSLHDACDLVQPPWYRRPGFWALAGGVTAASVTALGVGLHYGLREPAPGVVDWRR